MFSYSSTSGLFYLRADTVPTSSLTTFSRASVSLIRLFTASSTYGNSTALFYSFATVFGADSIEFSLSTTTTYIMESVSDYTAYSILTIKQGFTPFITQGLSTIYYSTNSARVVFVRVRGISGAGNPQTAWSSWTGSWFVDTTFSVAPTASFNQNTTSLISQLIGSSTVLYMRVSWTKVNTVAID